MPVSGATLVRLVRQVPLPPQEAPRIVGVDDWAWRKGRLYGTLLVDFERHRPLDLLPTRDGAAPAAWLAQYPQIQVVTRDRSAEYAAGVTEGAPQATPVADRWHLLHNLRAMVAKHVQRLHGQLRKRPQSGLPLAESAPELEVTPTLRRYALHPSLQRQQAARQAEREARYHAMRAPYVQGAYITQIAQEFGVCRATASRWVRADSAPVAAPHRGARKASIIDPYVRYLQQRIADGCHNQSQLWREIQVQGFPGTRSLVSKWVRGQYRSVRTSKAQHRVPFPSSKRLAWLLLRGATALSQDEQVLLCQLQQEPSITLVRSLALHFREMIMQRYPEQLDPWLTACAASGVPTLRNFAKVLQRDYAAVRAALTQPWSNGQAEGHNRLKLLKRQMYGRAHFDLLRVRVLFPA